MVDDHNISPSGSYLESLGDPPHVVFAPVKLSGKRPWRPLSATFRRINPNSPALSLEPWAPLLASPPPKTPKAWKTCNRNFILLEAWGAVLVPKHPTAEKKDTLANNSHKCSFSLRRLMQSTFHVLMLLGGWFGRVCRAGCCVLGPAPAMTFAARR
ncbi:hypothetical protein VTI74DRAFT_5035 [Chaetomium olivicolor]